jgi:hypothetical protein
MPLVLLPWIAAEYFTAGAWAVLNFLVYAVLVFAVGYCIVCVALPVSARTEAIPLAPAAGILAVSALTTFWLRLGFPLLWVASLWFGLALVGVLGLWRDRAAWAKNTVAYGRTLALLSLLICAVFFLPGARNDAVLRPDGSFNWMYVDTQHFYSIAASIKRGESPPRTPGTATADLLYHFGPYAPAAVISRLDGLNLGDALARVTRGASIWALVLSCFGLGTLLSLKAGRAKFGGVASVAGLFFYGSLLSLFTDESNSASHVTGAILFKIPNVGVQADGGPFSHLILGHSVLHGLIAITVVMGLCMIGRDEGAAPGWRRLILLTLPALAVPINSVAALYCLGVAGILLFWNHLAQARSWLLTVLMLCLFLGAWHIMGYGQATDAATATINAHLAEQWWPITVWFLIGLGFRILAFRWISRPLSDPLCALVIATVLGLLLFDLSLELRDGNQRYGIYYLQSVLSIFAFSLLTPGCWRGMERSRWVAEWTGLATKGMTLLALCGILARIVVYATHSNEWVASFRLQILPFLFLLILLTGISALMKRSRRFSSISSAIVMGVLMIGFLAWITPWMNFGLGRMKMDLTLAPGEVRGLDRLGEVAPPGEWFATNKHAVDSIATHSERSYGYTALSGRPALLEGYLDRGETGLPWFKSMLRDNDLLFSTTDPQTLRGIANIWHVRWLVARPGTDISVAKPLPPWLVEQQDSGTLKIYRIN